MDLNPPRLTADLTERFSAIVGTGQALRDAASIAPFLIEPRDKFHGTTPLVLRPGSVDEVSAILELASKTGTPVVPQGGNTGLVGGQVPDSGGGQIVLSLSRLNRIRSVEPQENAMTLEAGVILADAQAAASAADRLFPVSLASEGSCQIGGILSTNAGGTAVLAYGNTREQVLGIEVVLPSGEVWNGLRKLRKDNTGYDLRDLFVGAEGTLGVITAAVLRLVPKPRGQSVAIVGLKTPAAALGLLEIALKVAGGSLTAFELMPRIGIEFVTRHTPGTRDPLASPHVWYVLFEISSLRAEADAEATVEAIFDQAVADGLVEDGVQARSLQQAQAFWQLRHALSEVQKAEGGSIKHDVAVPRALVPEFIDRANTAVTGLIPGSRPFPFGHLGDGNIHYNVSQPVGADKADFLGRWDDVNALVYEIVGALGGTVSAEHGIGRLKRDLLAEVKSPIEIDLMRRVKAAFDPAGILNPGKVL